MPVNNMLRRIQGELSSLRSALSASRCRRALGCRSQLRPASSLSRAGAAPLLRACRHSSLRRWPISRRRLHFSRGLRQTGSASPPKGQLLPPGSRSSLIEVAEPTAAGISFEPGASQTGPQIKRRLVTKLMDFHISTGFIDLTTSRSATYTHRPWDFTRISNFFCAGLPQDGPQVLPDRDAISLLAASLEIFF